MASSALDNTIGQSSPVSTNDRLGFGLFLALALHGLLILGVGFTPNDIEQASPTLEITLARFQSENADKNADYVAQFDQAGSGKLDEKRTLTTETLSPFQDVTIREVVPEPTIKAHQPQQQSTSAVITTQRDNPNYQLQTQHTIQQSEQIKQKGKDKTRLQRSQEIATMEARLDKQRQMDAKSPRIHRLASVSTKSAVDAAYLHNWRSKIEVVGNLYYPEQARTQKIFGKLILLVTVLPDGSLFETKVLKSSGHRVLDDAAIQTVQRAAPFDAFPPKLLQVADRLEIIRTWEYNREYQMSAE